MSSWMRMPGLTVGVDGKVPLALLPDAVTRGVPTPLQVRSFAAGDGVTDDRARILEAEAMAALTGRALDFGGPESVFAISAQLTVAAGRRWISQGATVRPMPGFSAGQVLNVTGVSNITVDGLKIDGNKAGVAGNVVGVEINPTGGTLTGLRLRVEVVNTKSYGIRQQGALVDGNLDGSRVSGTDSSGISFQGTGVAGLSLRGLRLKNIGSTTLHVGLQVYGTSYYNSDVTVSDVTVDGCTGVPFEMQYITGLTYTSNKAIGSGLRGHSFGYIRDFTITGPVSVDQGIYGIELSHMTRGTITAPAIYNCESGIGGQTCVNVDIINPLIVDTDASGLNPYGIYIQTAGTKNLTIDGAHLIDIGLYGIRVTGAPENVTIRNVTYVSSATNTLVSDPIAVVVDDWNGGYVQDVTAHIAQAGSGGNVVGAGVYVVGASSHVRVRRVDVRSTSGTVLAKSAVAVAAGNASIGLRISDVDAYGLDTGVRTLTATTNDIVVRRVHTENVTNPVVLKSTHTRSTVEWYEGTGSPEGTTTARAPAVYVQTDGVAGTVVWVKTSGTGNTGWTAAGSSPTSALITASGTWMKPAGYTVCDAVAIGGGGGSGSGACRAAGGVRTGGAGGGGAARVTRRMVLSALGATEAVAIGAGGTAGAAVSTNDTNGNPGGAGGTTSFGGWMRALGGGAGAGGGTAAAAGGSSAIGMFDGAAGAASSATGAAGTAGTVAREGAPGGASGGGVTAGDVAGAGAAGAGTWASLLVGGAAGAVAGNGGAGVSVSGQLGSPGTSGGSGGGATSGAAGNGGPGGAYGAGAGGGGAGTNGGSSGAGAAGGAGMLLLIYS